MTDVSPSALAKELLKILARDKSRLQRIDNYVQGHHDNPYMPERADEEYKLLAKRAVSNWMPLLVGTPAQALYVDGFRRGQPEDVDDLEADLDVDLDGVEVPKAKVAQRVPEWDHWQRSRLDSRQAAIYRGALAFGHSFTVTERLRNGKISTKGLSALRTSALFEDPANDDTPYAALTVTKWPKGENGRGKARMWDDRNEYEVSFKSLDDDKSVRVTKAKRHGSSECPVTRFAASVDLEGRTVGVVEPMIALQNRINQTVFDLLVAQTYGSFKVRWATGMAPPLKMKPIYDETGEEVVDWEPERDPETGQPIPAEINLNAKRFLFGEDSEINFGTLDGTPLDGYINSIDMSIRHLAAVSQTPPHHLLGQIANLSAEALTAAETALARKIEEFRHSFGESWERVFRLAAELNDDAESAEDFHGEVIWRDMEARSMAQTSDALLKLKELGVPERGLWRRVPGVTTGEIEDWEAMKEEDDPEVAMSGALRRATGGNVRRFSPSPPPPSDENAVA